MPSDIPRLSNIEVDVAIWQDEHDTDPQAVSDSPCLLPYVAARKRIYLPLFLKLVKTQSQFSELCRLVESGKNILIIEVDGPHQESLPYYQSTYDVPQDFIQDDTIVADPAYMDIMLNDEKYAFGHGYCLALAIQDALGI